MPGCLRLPAAPRLLEGNAVCCARLRESFISQVCIIASFSDERVNSGYNFFISLFKLECSYFFIFQFISGQFQIFFVTVNVNTNSVLLFWFGLELLFFFLSLSLLFSNVNVIFFFLLIEIRILVFTSLGINAISAFIHFSSAFFLVLNLLYLFFFSLSH